MMKTNSLLKPAIVATALFSFGASAHAAETQLDRLVNETIRPVMAENDVPGMAVAITVQGKRQFFYYGVASKQGGQKVAEDTLFEIGSVSKTFTATLGGYAQARGTMSLTDNASRHLPALAGSAFDGVSMLDLGTYTAGGLPLQFPGEVTDLKKMTAYFKGWRPAYAAGDTRVYSNPSMGLFGDLAARSMGKPFEDLMEQTLFPALGLSRTWIRIPQAQMASYASGYSKDNKPMRAMPGVLGSEAWGVKSTAADMIKYVEANINSAALDETLRRAIATTQTTYYKVGDTMQGLGWEMYAWPVDLDRLLAGNSAQMTFKPNKVSRLSPPLPPQQGVLINKTGSTNGFGAYVAFVPAKRIGIVMLANKNYSVPARVKAAHRILTALDSQAGATSAR
jgi:beta-lactamase class C